MLLSAKLMRTDLRYTRFIDAILLAGDMSGARVGRTTFPDKIEESIRTYDKLLLVLSEHSVASGWVEREVRAAFEKEEKSEPHARVLFPIRLDNAVIGTSQAWAADIRRTRHIGDFTGWSNPELYQQALERLTHDLEAQKA